MPARVLAGAGVAGLVLVGGLVAAGLATGRLDREVLTQSTLSMRYRWEYWQGAWRVITAPAQPPAISTFWAGVGPGNFGPHYLLHKLPESSEEIHDPHNLFLEVWATAGVWAVAGARRGPGAGPLEPAGAAAPSSRATPIVRGSRHGFPGNRSPGTIRRRARAGAAGLAGALGRPGPGDGACRRAR